MLPIITGSNYNQIAQWWHERHNNSAYGLNMLEKAISFCTNKRNALDVGCGSGGRFIRAFEKAGFASITGIDVSDVMISMAAENHPNHTFYVQDICEFESDEKYDLITAWDSIFHLPLSTHALVLEKMCRLLAQGGVLLYTLGDHTGEASGKMQDVPFYYSSIGVNANLTALIKGGVSVRHVELDQRPHKHVCIIGVKQ